MVICLVSHSPHVYQLTFLLHAVIMICDSVCDVTISVTVVTPFFCDSVTCHIIFPVLHLSNKRKGKEILNNDLAVLPSHDTG